MLKTLYLRFFQLLLFSKLKMKFEEKIKKKTEITTIKKKESNGGMNYFYFL
jgi:hypothetical protein